MSDIFTDMAEHDHEQVVFCADPAAGLRAIIALHDTTLGPALGGVRLWPYAREADALRDVLRLARGMTYKAAAAGINLGGGKCVVLGDPHRRDREALFRALGRFIETLHGRYLAGIDVGTSMADMRLIEMETRHVTCVLHDPSPLTALGVYQAMRAGAAERWGSDALAGKHVAVQGVGHVGAALVGLLYAAGATATVCDVNPANAEAMLNQYKVTVVEPGVIYDVPCDLFAPCATGGALNPTTIPRLQCEIVAGAANNQLATDADGWALHERGILYLPDFVANAGGLILLDQERQGHTLEQARHEVLGVYDTMCRVIELAQAEEAPTFAAANLLAEHRLQTLRGLKPIWNGIDPGLA